MRAAAGAITAAGLALSACQQSANQPASSNAGQPVNAGPGETPPVIVPPATGPDARTPLAEPKDAIDPKSAEAAAQVVQHYGALVEQARFSEAESLWSDAAAHALACPVKVHRAAFEILRRARVEHGDEPVDEIGPFGQVGGWVPAQTVGR